MTTESFQNLRPLPVLTEVTPQKLPDLRYSNSLNFSEIAEAIRFNTRLVVGGVIQIGQCRFKTAGLLDQAAKVIQDEIKASTWDAARLESELPNAMKLAKGRKRFLSFTFGQTQEEQVASKLKDDTKKRHNKERKTVENKVNQKKQEIDKFAKKNGITEHQRRIFEHMIAVEDFIRDHRVAKHRDLRKVKQDLRDNVNDIKSSLEALHLPLSTRFMSRFVRLKSTTGLLIPKYQEYINLITGYEQDNQRVLGLRDYTRQLDEIMSRQNGEMAVVDNQVSLAKKRAGLADEMKEKIKFYRERLGALQVLITRVMGASKFLDGVYLSEGPETLLHRLQQSRIELSQLKDEQREVDGVYSTVRRQEIKDRIAVVTSRIKDLETKLEIAINPLRRLDQEDAPRDLRAVVKRVTQKKYDPTKVLETDRVFDDLVLILAGRKNAYIIDPQWQDHLLNQNVA